MTVTFKDNLYTVNHRGIETVSANYTEAWTLFIEATRRQEFDPWNIIREMRDLDLSLSDWTQVVDNPLSQGQRKLWQTYRQQLRDLPQRYTDPAGVVWPTPPAG